MRKRLMQWLFPDVIQFIQDLYAMPRDPSYFIHLPEVPPNIKELVWQPTKSSRGHGLTM